MTSSRRLVIRKYPDVESHLGLYLDESGLVLSGQDFGRGIAMVTSGSDYEYWITVPTQHLDRLHQLLRERIGRHPTDVDDHGRNEEILEMVRDAFRTGEFENDADYQRWLALSKIPTKFSSY